MQMSDVRKTDDKGNDYYLTNRRHLVNPLQGSWYEKEPMSQYVVVRQKPILLSMSCTCLTASVCKMTKVVRITI